MGAAVTVCSVVGAAVGWERGWPVVMAVVTFCGLIVKMLGPVLAADAEEGWLGGMAGAAVAMFCGGFGASLTAAGFMKGWPPAAVAAAMAPATRIVTFCGILCF